MTFKMTEAALLHIYAVFVIATGFHVQSGPKSMYVFDTISLTNCQKSVTRSLHSNI